MTPLIHSQIEKSTVHLKIQDVTRQDLNAQVLQELQETIEGSCGKYGYVLRGSTVLTDRSVGKIVTSDSESHLEFKVTYNTETIYPCKDDEYECKINSITKMGILGYLEYKVPGDDNEVTIKNSPVQFILPDEFIEDVPETHKQIGKTLKVQVLETRIKYRAHQIQVVAKPSV